MTAHSVYGSFASFQFADVTLLYVHYLLQDPHHLYTFCPEFHHSMTLAKNTLKEARKQEARLSRARWMTSFGWRHHGRMDSIEANRHPLYPDRSKIEELMIVSINF